MKYGESSPEQDPIAAVAEKRLEDLARAIYRETQAEIRKSEEEFRKKLGMKPDETLAEFLGIVPKHDPDPALAAQSDKELNDAICDLLVDEVGRKLAPELDWEAIRQEMKQKG
jgi:hypothetical protein